MPDPTSAPPPQAKLAGNWRRYLRFWGARAEADVDDELRFHFDMRVRDHMSRGMSEAEARAAVIRRLGALGDARTECIAITHRRERRMTRAHVLDAFLQDLRFALRGFGRQKAWTFVAILTLALGIGANTAVFSVINSLVLNPLPYPGADRVALLFLRPSNPSDNGVTVTITPNPTVARAWLEQTRSFEAVEAYRQTSVTFIHRDDDPATLQAAYIRPSLPRFAGAPVLLGRMFSEQEVAGKAKVVLLSEGTWRTRFGSDPAVVGRLVNIDDAEYTVIGVMSRQLVLPRFGRTTADLWAPIDLGPNSHGTSLMGRLRPGMTHAVAIAELDSVMARAEAGQRSAGRFAAQLMAPSDMVGFKQSLFMLMGAVGLVLLIACVNVAHLMLARAATRQRELAVRIALGAGRGRLLRQLLTESLVLSLAGSIGGLAVAAAGVRALRELRPDNLEALGAARMDGAVLLVALGLAIVTGLAFGIVATIQAARHSTHEALKAGALTTSQSRGQHRVRGLLVVTEMALSTTLLVGASLLVRSMIHLQTSDPGFDPERLYSVQAQLPEARYPNAAAREAFYTELLARTRAVPGVAEVTVATDAPPGFRFNIGAMHVEGQAEPDDQASGLLRFTGASPSYFRTLRMPVVEGRTFADTSAGSTEIMVNQGFAKKHWPGESAIGKRLRIKGFGRTGPWQTIVGIVGDASTGGLTHDRSDPILYQATGYRDDATLIVRARPGAEILPALRAVVASLDSRLPPPRLTDIQGAMADSVALPRFTMLLLVGFTVLALILAAIGLYGVMSYGVAQRTREIGIRMALGASRATVSRDVVSRGVALAAAGVVVGLVGSWWATRVIEKMLYGVSRTDPIAFAAGAAVLLGTALLACIIPMNRAASVDPAIAMRAD